MHGEFEVGDFFFKNNVAESPNNANDDRDFSFFITNVQTVQRRPLLVLTLSKDCVELAIKRAQSQTSLYSIVIMPKISVIAPATLDEGYTFEVMLDGQLITVTVPEGGVKKGEEFQIPYDSNLQTIPTGVSSEEGDDEDEESGSERTSLPPTTHWRQSLCSCCDVVTQSTFYMGFCCTPVLIAQLLTRLRLNYKGKREDDPEEISLSFNRIVMSFICVLLLGYIPVVGFVIVSLYLFLVIVWIGSNVRNEMRRKYKIKPSTNCECADDCVCMCLCGCCSAIQMARHTHNDKEYPGYCCTTTGLEPLAPSVV